MKVIEPDQDLSQLYERVIGEPARLRHAKSLRRHLGDKLTSAGLEKKVVRDITVNVPVLQKEVEIPFGFQNGRFNLINPVRFAAADAESAIVTACKYAVEGRSLYENADPERGDLQLVVVGQFRPKDQETLRRVKHVFDENSVRLYRTEEIPSLIDEIRRTGKEIRDGG